MTLSGVEHALRGVARRVTGSSGTKNTASVRCDSPAFPRRKGGAGFPFAHQSVCTYMP